MKGGSHHCQSAPTSAAASLLGDVRLLLLLLLLATPAQLINVAGAASENDECQPPRRLHSSSATAEVFVALFKGQY